VTGFPEFPNTSPSGKRVDSDDPIPRTFRKFSKKRHPRNVGGDTRRPGSQRRLNRGALRETTPPGPINSGLALLKIFLLLSSLSRFSLFSSFAEPAFSARNLRTPGLVRAFLRYFFIFALLFRWFVKLWCSNVTIFRVLFSNIILICLNVRMC
jgi:hypothetical protein